MKPDPLAGLNPAQRAAAWVLIVVLAPFVCGWVTYKAARRRVWAWTVNR